MGLLLELIQYLNFNDIMKKVRISVEYKCSPFWEEYDDDCSKNISINSLPISEMLKQEFHNWDSVFQSTRNKEYPSDSGFKNELVEKQFYITGRDLFKKIMRELEGSYLIRYRNLRDYKIYSEVKEIKLN